MTPRDTHPEIERRQIELLREGGPARRLAMALSMSEAMVMLSRRAIAERNPGLSEREVALRQFALCHGEELAGRLRECLKSNGML